MKKKLFKLALILVAIWFLIHFWGCVTVPVDRERSCSFRHDQGCLPCTVQIRTSSGADRILHTAPGRLCDPSVIPVYGSES